MAKVYHALEPSFGFAEHKFPDEYALVATVASEEVEKIYELTNNIDNPWWENDKVTPEFIGEGCRSTSVGDVIKLDNGSLLLCRNIGWEKFDA